MTKGVKDDLQKARPSLILRTMSKAIKEVVKVAEFGARKYSPDNWQYVDNAEQRYLDAKMRHSLEFGEDEESGLLHLAHEAWNCLALLELELRRKQVLECEKVLPESIGQELITDEEEEAWREAEKRMELIGQNSSDGLHYWIEDVMNHLDVPSNAEYITLNSDGYVFVFFGGYRQRIGNLKNHKAPEGEVYKHVIKE